MMSTWNCFNIKFINLIGCIISLLLLFTLHLLNNDHDRNPLLILKLFQWNQIIQYPVYASIIVAILVKKKDPVLLPSIFYQCITISNILLIICQYIFTSTMKTDNFNIHLIIVIYACSLPILWLSMLSLIHI